MTFRAAHASELLGTRVQVTTTDQNRQLLAQMDQRAAQQARLQETVEGTVRGCDFPIMPSAC